MDLAESLIGQSLSKHPFFLHPDLLVLYPEAKTANHTLEQIHSFINFVHERPSKGMCRCVIIDDADRILPLHSNAILKAFEEHPETVYIFLVSSHKEAIIPTLQSRCWKASFIGCSNEDICESIKKYDVDHDVVADIIKYSNGSFFTAERLALEFLEHKQLFFKQIERFINPDAPMSMWDISKLADKLSLEIQRQKEIFTTELEESFSIQTYKEITPYQKEKLLKVKQARLALFEIRFASCYLDLSHQLLSEQLKLKTKDISLGFYQRALDLIITTKDQLNKSMPISNIFEFYFSMLHQKTPIWISTSHF